MPNNTHSQATLPFVIVNCLKHCIVYPYQGIAPNSAGEESQVAHIRVAVVGKKSRTVAVDGGIDEPLWALLLKYCLKYCSSAPSPLVPTHTYILQLHGVGLHQVVISLVQGLLVDDLAGEEADELT